MAEENVNRLYTFSTLMNKALTQTMEAQMEMVSSGKDIIDHLAFYEKDGKQVAKMTKVTVNTEHGTKSLTMPVLSISPSTPMQIDGAELNFTLDLDMSEVTEMKNNSGQTLGRITLPVSVVRRRLLARQKRALMAAAIRKKTTISKFGAFSIRKKTTTITASQKKLQALLQAELQAQSNEVVEETKTGHVNINTSVMLGQAEMPYGISRLLQIAQSQGVRVFDKDTRQWVFVTREGDCYHKENCRYIKGHTTNKVVCDDELRGKKRACKVCKP